MQPTTRREPVAGRPARGLGSDRNRSRSDLRHPAYRAARSFADDLATDIRPPIVRAGIFAAPFLRALAVKHFFDCQLRDDPANNDFSVPRFDFETLAGMQLRLPGDVPGYADRQV